MQIQRPRGFSTIELLAVVTMLALLFAGATPLVLGWRMSTLSAAAEELKALLNTARTLAITQNTSVCVTGVGAGIRLFVGGCAGPVWTGPGTSNDGLIALTSSVRIIAGSPVVFTYLGAAVPAGSYTLEEPRDRASLRVVVSASGRIAVAR